jgi:hypothetical protein
MGLLTALLFLSGCIKSIYPVYTQDTLIYDPELVGTWVSEDSGCQLQFSKSGEKQYKLVYTGKKGNKAEFIVYLCSIEGVKFLDFFPERSFLKQNNLYVFNFLPVHTFALLEQIKPALKMRFPDINRIKTILESDSNSLQYQKTKNNFILTAKPEKLQLFWKQHSQNKNAFGKATNLKLVTDK